MLSPFLFNIYLNHLIDKIGTIKGVQLLAYADNIAVSFNNINAAKKVIALMNEETEKIKLQLNYSKCGLL